MADVSCPRCQARTSAEASFCDECGARLEISCGNCGEANRLTANFCKSCGQSLSVQRGGAARAPEPRSPSQSYIPKYLADRILAAREGIQGERKHVTVLFADIKGSTELIEPLDPEDARRLMEPALQIMMDAVHHYEGTVGQILGDGIMAFFGAPLAHEDHALRACYAALAMQREMSRYTGAVSGRSRAELKIRVGLNSGEVVFRSISNDLNIEYLAVGYTIHLAARMEELAPAGSIAMTAATAKEVEGFVRVKSLGAVHVKGVSAPVDIVELIDAAPFRKRLDVAALRGLTPFVGREAEIELFCERLESVLQGRGQVLSMIGGAGVGKSRLVYELTHRHLSPSCRLLEATSVSYGQASPYLPLISLFKRYFDIDERAAPAEVQAKIQASLLSLDGQLADAMPPLLSLLNALPDQPGNPGAAKESEPQIAAAIETFNALPPRQRREFTLSALTRILLRESQKQPLVVVVEDLHWIDNETQAFLDSLIDSLPAAPILLIVDYRPEYRHGWANKTWYTHVRLDPLPPNRAGEMLEHLIGNASGLGSVKDFLIRRTEGNPFFLEESVRTLAQSNVLIGEKGAYALAREGVPIRIPSTVQAVLAERVDRLSPEEKHLLQTASVIGMNVPFRLLSAVANVPEEKLRGHLDQLRAAEFLHEAALFPELQYAFKHALTNEVVYQALLHEQRKALHGHIVGALEQMPAIAGSDRVETLALHAFRGELWEKALRYSREAGLKALAASANRQAVTFFEQALVALEHLPQSRLKLETAVDLRLDLRNALFLIGEIGRIPLHLDEAQKAAELLNDEHRSLRVANFRIAYFSTTGQPDRAIEIGERALLSQVASAGRGAGIVTHYYMGIVYYTTGKYDEAMRVLNDAIAMIDAGNLTFERFGTSTIVSAICRTWLVQSLAQTGAFDEAIARGLEGLKIAEDARHPYSLGYVNCSLGLLFLMRGDLEQAVDKLERSLTLCREANIRVLFPQIASYLGFAYALSGRIAEALPLMQQAEEQTVSIGRTGGQALRLAWHGETQLLSGRIDEAALLARRACDLSMKHKERGHQAWSLRLMAEIAARRGDANIDESASLYKQSLALAQELRMAPLKAHCHAGLGLLLLRAGKTRDARMELSLASDLYRDMKMTHWLERISSAAAGRPAPARRRNPLET